MRTQSKAFHGISRYATRPWNADHLYHPPVGPKTSRILRYCKETQRPLKQCVAATSESKPRSRSLHENTLGTASHQFQILPSRVYSSHTGSPSYSPHRGRQGSLVTVGSFECLATPSSSDFDYTTSPGPRHSQQQNALGFPRTTLSYDFPPYQLQVADYVPCQSTNVVLLKGLAKYGLQRLRD